MNETTLLNFAGVIAAVISAATAMFAVVRGEARVKQQQSEFIAIRQADRLNTLANELSDRSTRLTALLRNPIKNVGPSNKWVLEHERVVAIDIQLSKILGLLKTAEPENNLNTNLRNIRADDTSAQHWFHYDAEVGNVVDRLRRKADQLQGVAE
ncbi:MAG: hypothetical protein AAF253_12355 [Pseudomonadota bacterium]